ncbi:MAG: response regulator [Candidatus Eisenbacteria bacterium]
MNERRPLALCVDDDPDVLTYLQVLLEAEGFTFASADCAEDGLIAFRKLRPDVLIIDMMMEEVDAGTGLVRDLRAEGNEAPVFMLSSVGDNLSYTLDANALGLAGVFQKPLRKEQLLSVLRAKVGRS